MVRARPLSFCGEDVRHDLHSTFEESYCTFYTLASRTSKTWCPWGVDWINKCYPMAKQERADMGLWGSVIPYKLDRCLRFNAWKKGRHSSSWGLRLKQSNVMELWIPWLRGKEYYLGGGGWKKLSRYAYLSTTVVIKFISWICTYWGDRRNYRSYQLTRPSLAHHFSSRKLYQEP